MRRWSTGIATGAAVAVAAAVGVVAALATASAASPATTQAASDRAGRPSPQGPSPLIYPAETIPIKFDHAAHARLGATCESCHSTAAAVDGRGRQPDPGRGRLSQLPQD